jgi:hypothetical protein
MRTFATTLALLVVPALAAAQEQPGEIAAPPPDGVAGAAEPTVDAAVAPAPAVSGLPAGALDVAYAAGVPGLAAGGRVEPGGALELPAGGCLRLVAADRAALTLCGPARARVEAAGDGRVTVLVDSGRGVLLADAPGAAISVAGRALVVEAGSAAFDSAAAQAAWLLAGRGSLDGAALAAAPAEAPADLRRPTLCSPPRPSISIRLGEPSAVIAAAAERRRSREREDDSTSSSAESSATCVDSADSSSATDPSQGGEGGVDPDARRDAGRVRIVVDVPWRSR